MENKKINWYPGHMFKAKKEIQSELKSVDAVVEVVDARVPNSSHNKMLDEIVANKKKMIVFSKVDLADKEKFSKFEKEYQKNGYKTLSVNNMNSAQREKVIKEIEKMCKEIYDRHSARGIHKTMRILIIGMPNVGKSSLINLLAGKNKTNVANRPGVTKIQQVIKVDDKFEVVDTPGVLIPKIENLEIGYNLVLNSLIKDEVVELQDIGFYLLKKLAKMNNVIQRRYSKVSISTIEAFKDETDIESIEKMYNEIGQSLGLYKNSTGAEYEKITIKIINDYRKLKFGKIILDEV